MIERTVRGNTIFIRGSKCALQISVIAPSKIFVRLTGNDDGELGRIPFDDLKSRLGSDQTIELFIDTSEATGVSNVVTEQWQKWFTTNRNHFKKIHLFATSKFFLITAAIIKELSRSGEIFQIYSDAGKFQQSIGTTEWRLIDQPSAETQTDSTAAKRFEGVLSAVQFERLRPGVVYLAISGRDTGDTLDEVLGALNKELEAFPGPLEIFVDASKTTGVTPRVSESWTRWITAHQDRLSSIEVLTNSRLVTLIVSAAQIFSRTGNLLNVVGDAVAFFKRLEAAAPGSRKN